MDNDIKFNYFLPQLGRINVRLFKYPSQCYTLLDNYKHIERLKNIDHLGVIRNAFEGAHHPRWEYVVLQLNLINRLCNLNDAKGSGLSSKTEFLGLRPSGAEILQLWILLLNSGHLPGTFASERGLLKAFQNSSKLRNTFKSGLRSNKKKLFDDIIKNEDIYGIHKLLISFHLDRYKRFTDYDTDNVIFIDFLQEILDFYLFEQEQNNLEQKRYDLKSIFTKIRQVSYLFLDSHYAPFPISFDISKIFLNLEDNYYDLFLESDTQILKTLSSFDDLLSTGMYHSEISISELGKHSKEIRKKIESKRLSRISDINGHLKNISLFEPNKFIDEGDIFQILFDLTIDSRLKKYFKKYLCFDNEKKWNNLFGINHCLLTFQSSPSIRQYVINLKLLKNSTPEKNVKILGHLLKNYLEFYFSLRKEVNKEKGLDYAVDMVFKKPNKEFMINILNYISKPGLYFKFNDYGQDSSVLSAHGSKTASKTVYSIFESADISNSRRNEVNALVGTLNNIDHRGKLLISLAPILVFDDNRNTLTDLDGFAIGFLRNNLKILLIEAKDQKNRGMSKSRHQLRRTLDKLELKTSARMDIIESHANKCVFTYFNIDGNI